MLNTLDTVIAFAVIMTVLSLLITIVVQMVSAALSLRGKNLANALSLTFQTIDPRIGDHAHSLAAQILRDPIFSDSILRKKSRLMVPAVHDAGTQALIDAERRLKQAELDLATNRNEAAKAAKQQTVDAAKAAVESARPAATVPTVQPNRAKPWAFWSWPWGGGTQLGTAIRPGEIYRILHEFDDLTETEAALRDIPPALVTVSTDLLAALRKLDHPAVESQSKLRVIAKISEFFPDNAQRQAVVDSLTNFSATVERATTQAYDRFQRWFGSAEDRAEQWFQMHTRIVTVAAAVAVAFLLQLDTMEMYRQLRANPKLVEALLKSAPGVQEQGGPVLNPRENADKTPEGAKASQEARKKAFDELKKNIDEAGFDLAPTPLFSRWKDEHPSEWLKDRVSGPLAIVLQHLLGLLFTAGLLALGAPFWFNLLKNLMSLRPAVANLIEKRPTSAPALPATPAQPPSSS
jgi:hypothetical protein